MNSILQGKKHILPKYQNRAWKESFMKKLMEKNAQIGEKVIIVNETDPFQDETLAGHHKTK